jgi:hypothetical protein
MPKDLDFCNMRCARADAKAEEKYLKFQEEAEDERYKQYEEKELRKNAKKTCKFCHQLGHVVYQYGVLTCPKLKDTTCRRCGLLGHTHKFCNF